MISPEEIERREQMKKTPVADMTVKELAKAHIGLQHAIQSGIKAEVDYGYENLSGTSPKHLRVGVSTALRDHSALVGLLIKKEVITEREYLEAIVISMRKEVERIENELAQMYGNKVDLY